MMNSRRVSSLHQYKVVIGIAAVLVILAFIVWEWTVDVTWPSTNGELLLLATGTKMGVPLYKPSHYGYEPDQKHRQAPRASLLPDDLVIAHGEISGYNMPGPVPMQTNNGPSSNTSWVRIYAVHSPSGKRPRSELSWATCARISDLVPIRLDAVPGLAVAPSRIHTKLDEFWARQSYGLAQYDTEIGTVISLLYTSGTGYCVYRLDERNRIHWMFTAAYQGSLYMLFPGLRVVPECRGADGVPDILAFQPPLGLVCWRWQGERFAVALPRLREIPLLLGLLLQGYIWWLSILVALAPAYFLGLRHVMARSHAVVLLAWWGIFIGLGIMTSQFLQRIFLGIMLGALVVVVGWIALTHKPHKVTLGRLCLSVVLPVVFSLALILWLIMLEGYFEVNGIGMP